jgi:hypothetical protein
LHERILHEKIFHKWILLVELFMKESSMKALGILQEISAKEVGVSNGI